MLVANIIHLFWNVLGDVPANCKWHLKILTWESKLEIGTVISSGANALVAAEDEILACIEFYL